MYSCTSDFSICLAAVTIAVDRAANLDLHLALIAFSSERCVFFYAPRLLRHRYSVYTVSSERPAPMSHSGIRTHFNNCANTVKIKGIGSILFLKNRLKKIFRKNYKNHLRRNGYEVCKAVARCFPNIFDLTVLENMNLS
jgi:hypothetical protein